MARYSAVPINARRMVAQHLPMFRMQVERSVYYAGEVVRGHVVFNVGKPRKIRAVRVKFEGVSKTEYNVGDSNPQNASSMKNAHAKIIWYNPTATLHGNPRGNNSQFSINSGAYVWPYVVSTAHLENST
jgi:hypothetical protein